MKVPLGSAKQQNSVIFAFRCVASVGVGWGVGDGLFHWVSTHFSARRGPVDCEDRVAVCSFQCPCSVSPQRQLAWSDVLGSLGRVECLELCFVFFCT